MIKDKLVELGFSYVGYDITESDTYLRQYNDGSGAEVCIGVDVWGECVEEFRVHVSKSDRLHSLSSATMTLTKKGLTLEDYVSLAETFTKSVLVCLV